MAELDFKHHVGQVPAGQALQEPAQRHVGADIPNVPDYLHTFSNYAANTNWLSNIGSTVAGFASNAIAAELGGQYGKNPRGTLTPPISDFDKTFTQSYNTQAQATLGLQANKLITDSSLEVARATKITPELIARTSQQVSSGLNNIFRNAPNEIRPHLEYQYGTQQTHQIASLTEKMIKQQQDERVENTKFASKVNAENAYSFAVAGDYKGALAAIEATKKANDADVSAGLSTPLIAKTNVDTAIKSYLSGKYIHEYDRSRAEGKSESFLRDFVDNKPSDISDKDYQSVLANVLQHVNLQHTLLKQDQALTMASFKVKLAENPLSITGSDIAELKSKLDPLQFQEASLSYVQAVKSLQSKKNGVAEALQVYTNINDFPHQTAENKNGAWEATYKAMLQQPQNQQAGMTEDTAKLYAAAAAPVAIPRYVQELNAKLNTADPVNLETAGQALNYMTSHNLNQNIIGVGNQQLAVAEVYKVLRESMNPVEAAQKAHETVFNKSKDQREANAQALKDYYRSAKKKNETYFSMIRRIIETPSNLKIRNLPGYTQKANSVFETFFNITNGDESTSAKLTKQYMDSQYGKSRVNGDAELMYHPIEKIPGIPEDATGAIQSDLVEQANNRFSEDHKLFQEGKIDYWFEARQRISADEAMTSKKIVDAINENNAKHPITGLIFDVKSKRQELKRHADILKKYNSQTITIIKHNRSGQDEVFEGAIQANPWAVNTGNPAQPISGGWDLMIKTENGMSNIPLMNPLKSNIQYNPRVDYIKNLYMATQGLSTVDNILSHSQAGTLAHYIYEADQRAKGKK